MSVDVVRKNYEANAQHVAEKNVNYGELLFLMRKTANAGENIEQRPRYRSFSFEKRKGVWRARLYCRGQHTTLGRYPTAELASEAHDIAASFVMGNRVTTNLNVPNNRHSQDSLPFSVTVTVKLAALRDATCQGNQHGANEHEARAIRFAAAKAAFWGFFGESSTYIMAVGAGQISFDFIWRT